MTKTQADYNWLLKTHAHAKGMGLTDKQAVEVAETDGDLDPEALRLYKEKYKCK